jgi:hypothetical protein
MTVTLHLKPEVEAGLQARAQASGMALEDYLLSVVEEASGAKAREPEASPGESGMVWENGLLVYRNGNPLPAHVVDDAIRQSREERSQQILGERS